jgi:hypothetical protein
VHKIVKSILFFFVLAVGCVEGRAQLKADPASLDLGRRLQEQIALGEVKLTNAGAAPLEIANVLADCSCTVATPEKRALAPGESTTLKIAVETRTYQGAIHRNIRVQTSAGELSLPVDLTVSLYKSWQLNPSPVVLPPSQKGHEATLPVTLQYTGTDKVNIGKITSNPDWLKATASSEDGKTFSLALLKRADAPVGNHTVKIVVETSDPAEPQLTLTVFVPIASALRITPNPVVLPTVKVGQPAIRELAIQGWNGATEPRLELTQGQVKKRESEGERMNFEIAVIPIAPGPFTQLLRIFDGDRLEAEIPVILRAEPADKAK